MDAAVDVEPAIIKQTNSTGSGTIIVHMKYDTNGLSNFYYYTTANGNAPAKLDPPAYYTQTGDPFLTESQLDSGQSQRRVYLTGLVTNFPFTWAVAVWHSDNLGQSWTLGTNLLAAGTSDLDKPTCDVSHHSGSAGYCSSRIERSFMARRTRSTWRAVRTAETRSIKMSWSPRRRTCSMWRTSSCRARAAMSM